MVEVRRSFSEVASTIQSKSTNLPEEEILIKVQF